MSVWSFLGKGLKFVGNAAGTVLGGGSQMSGISPAPIALPNLGNGSGIGQAPPASQEKSFLRRLEDAGIDLVRGVTGTFAGDKPFKVDVAVGTSQSIPSWLPIAGIGLVAVFLLKGSSGRKRY